MAKYGNGGGGKRYGMGEHAGGFKNTSGGCNSWMDTGVKPAESFPKVGTGKDDRRSGTAKSPKSLGPRRTG